MPDKKLGALEGPPLTGRRTFLCPVCAPRTRPCKDCSDELGFGTWVSHRVLGIPEPKLLHL